MAVAIGKRRRAAVILGPVYSLESRRMLSQTFTVTDPVNDGSTGSLNWAVQQVNEDTTDSTSSPDVIDFDIPGTGPFTMAAPGTAHRRQSGHHQRIQPAGLEPKHAGPG